MSIYVRGKQRWLDTVKRDIKELRLDWNEGMDHAYNREE
jgi:hypothetical protein